MDKNPPIFKITLGHALDWDDTRSHCAKCGEKHDKPVPLYEATEGYCGQCRFILRLRTSTAYDLEPLGYPRGANFSNRLKAEPEMFFDRHVDRWYEPTPGPSPSWRKEMAKQKKLNEQYGLN